MFIFLCLHHFDYIKDIGEKVPAFESFPNSLVIEITVPVPDISVILDHFDRMVVQSSYEAYHGFNFQYLFVTSVCLICTSHVVNGVYWAIRRAVNPKVNG